ncbi:MAG: NAD(P)/FAD-dependent oxidoreductase [Lachnospiraceae bacterium]|nr:NAD(P)/FAD-dependent oxidoreductase [Lachnospiraceae bacterium]
MKKTIAIIGGGVAGLSAGIYGQRAGYDTVIYEKNSVLGGSLSGWYRDGYAIDNCLHWLTGTEVNSPTYEMWKELGVIDDETKIVQRPFLLSSETDGVRVTLWRDTERTRKEMLEISPEDATEINLFIDVVNVASDITANLSHIMKLARTMSEAETVLSHFDFARRTMLYMGLNMQQWAAKFKSEAIRNLLLDFSAKEYESYWLILVYSFFASGNADIVDGGSIKIADNLIRTYVREGGKIEPNMAAKQIVLKKKKIPKIEKKAKIKTKRAETIVFENGEEVSADYIICACDLKYVFSKLIRKKSQKPKILHKIIKYEKQYPIYSAFHAAFAVDGLFEEIDDSLGFACNPIEVGMQKIERIYLKNYRQYGDYIAPEGKTVVQVMIIQYEKDFKFWKKLYKSDVERYKQAKLNIANAILSEIVKRFPDYEDRIKILDTWTPYTYARRNNDTNGAYMRFITTAISQKSTISAEISGVENAFLAGHWLRYPGGLPMAALSGKEAIDIINDRNKPVIPFINEIAEKITDVKEKIIKDPVKDNGQNEIGKAK